MKRISLLAVLLALACDQDLSPTSSTLPTTSEPSAVTAASSSNPSNPTVTAPDEPDDSWTKPPFVVSEGTVSTTITNPKNGPRYVGLACYAGQVHDLQGQELGAFWQVKLLSAGESATLTADLHCGYNQCDLFFDLSEPLEPPLYGSKLIGAKLINYDCPTCTTCECRNDCPTVCEPEGEPECSQQVWDPQLCLWMGDCNGCELTEPPLCFEDCEWNEELCEWDCGECRNECVPPAEQSFQAEGPFHGPEEECAFFGPYIPTDNEDGLFHITKCGLFYEVSHDLWPSEFCSNQQEVSHRTVCVCDEFNGLF